MTKGVGFAIVTGSDGLSVELPAFGDRTRTGVKGPNPLAGLKVGLLSSGNRSTSVTSRSSGVSDRASSRILSLSPVPATASERELRKNLSKVDWPAGFFAFFLILEGEEFEASLRFDIAFETI